MGKLLLLLVLIVIALAYSFKYVHQKQRMPVTPLFMSTKVQRNENFAKLQAGKCMNINDYVR